jgi:hypothetical protein
MGSQFKFRINNGQIYGISSLYESRIDASGHENNYYGGLRRQARQNIKNTVNFIK